MKAIVYLLATVLGCTAHAQSGDGSFYNSRDWVAAKVVHDFWNQESCVAQTIGDDGVTRLEVLALKGANGQYLEPIVQVVTEQMPVFLEVEATTGSSSEVFTLLPAALSDDPQALVIAMAKFNDREALVKAIRNKVRLTSMFLDTSGQVKEVRFSLRGSSNTIEALFSECELNFEPEFAEQLN